MPAALLLGLFLLFAPPFILLLSNKRRAISKKTHLPPSPPRLPFIGNLHQLGSPLHLSLCTLSEKYGPLLLLRLGQVPTLVVSSPQMAQEIMRTHDLLFASRPSVKVVRILLHGRRNDITFAPYGEYWRQARKIFAVHLLGAKMVQSFRKVREEVVALMIAQVSNESSSNGKLNMSDILISFASDLICRVVSEKFFQDEGRKRLVCKMVEEVNSDLFAKAYISDFFPRMEWLEELLGLDARIKWSSERWDDVLEAIIESHVDPLKEDGVQKSSNDFVDVLLSLQNESDGMYHQNKEDIKSLILEIFAAGVDTSYIVLEWSLAELVRNSESMKKLQDEVRGTTSRKDMVREDDLSKMNYLKAVIKEVLRLHPPAPLLLPRESMENCIVEGYEIPKKTRVLVNAWAIGRDPKYWGAPEEFRPERFIDNNVDFRGSDFQFIPFGAGRRICPGMNFAMSTVEHALANLVHRFDWEMPGGMTSDDLKMDEACGLTTRMKQRLHLAAKLRST